MVDHDLLHQELAQLASALGPDSDLHEGLHHLTVMATAALQIDGAGVTVQIPGAHTNYITAADPVTLRVERVQDALQEGACVDAIGSSQIVAVGDLTVEQPWPRFTPVLLDAGFRAAAGVPIPGVMGGRHGMSPEAAFEVMRGYARSERIKLHDVAHAVIAGHLDPVAGTTDPSISHPSDR